MSSNTSSCGKVSRPGAEPDQKGPGLKIKRDRSAFGKGPVPVIAGGRKSWAEINPELVWEAKRLRRRSPKGHQRSLREIAAELAKLGFVNERGVMFSAASVASMLA